MPACMESLRRHYDDASIVEMVTKEPLLLVEDVDTVLGELERLAPHSDRLDALRANPALASQVANLRGLSMW